MYVLIILTSRLAEWSFDLMTSRVNNASLMTLVNVFIISMLTDYMLTPPLKCARA